MAKSVAIVLGLCCLLLTRSIRAGDLYVSPAGDDGGPGTASQPLRTLAAAQKAARISKAEGGLMIHLGAGTYYLKQPLVLTPEDSGTKDRPRVWQADAGGNVIVSGGQKLDLKWQPYKSGIFQADVPADLSTDQLFVNGVRQVLARYPNYDRNIRIFNGYAADAISPERVARWSDPTGGYFHAMHPAQWGDFSYRITGKDAKGALSMEGGWQGNRPNQPHKQFRFVEGIFEELDAPGEWFLNSRTHTLYFYPPSGVDLNRATIEVVRLSKLIEFSGSESSPVRGIVFRGITFQHAARTFMETREPLLRSDWTIYRGGAIVFNGAEDCAVEDLFVDQVGGNAIFFNNYNRRVKVRGCRIDQSGASGVMFVGDPAAVRSPLFNYSQKQPVEKIDPAPGPKNNNYPADCGVEDCLITRVGRVEKQSTGVGIDMAARITVSHCSIYQTPRAGINIGDGCWGGHVVEFCDVFATVLETGDHGSFNSWGRDRYWLSNVKDVNALAAAHPRLPLADAVEPITLCNSRWRCDHGWDIDLDDGSSNYHIYNNLCLHGGIKNREGFSRVVENNILVANTFHPHVWFDNSGDSFARNIVFSRYRPVGMPRRWGKEIDFNLLHDPTKTEPMPATELAAVSGQDAHSVVASATFVDPQHGDFRVNPGSAALMLGFKNFAMDQFGVQKAELRAIARVPSFAEGEEAISKRDASVHDWRSARVRNIVGMGEMSAHGLAGETGVLVLEVRPGSELADAGLQKNDVIVAVGALEVGSVSDLPASDASGPDVKLLAIKVVREQTERTLRVPVQ